MVLTTTDKGQLIEVIGGTHGALYNLYRYWAPMYDELSAFLRGEDVAFPAAVTLP